MGFPGDTIPQGPRGRDTSSYSPCQQGIPPDKRAFQVENLTSCSCSANNLVAAKLRVAKYMAVVVPLESSRAISLEYSERATASCACLASDGNVWSSSQAIRGLSVAVPAYEYCKQSNRADIPDVATCSLESYGDKAQHLCSLQGLFCTVLT